MSYVILINKIMELMFESYLYFSQNYPEIGYSCLLHEKDVNFLLK